MTADGPSRAVGIAPASIGNVAVGFDILGLAFDAAEDRVIAERTPAAGIRLGRVTGLVSRLPEHVSTNTALAGARGLLEAAGDPFGVVLHIDKGVPVSAGMGGSAASAVAAVIAVNALLPEPLAVSRLLAFALAGERVAADPPPWDNVAASLLGGLVLVAQTEPPLLRRLPIPPGLVTILVHPDATTETRAARAMLRPTVPMADAVEHGRRVAAFVAGCAAGDLDLVRACMVDTLVERQRARLLPGFAAVQAAALEAGALGCSFSGSGPSMFAWATAADEVAVTAAMEGAMIAAGHPCRVYRAGTQCGGARAMPCD